MLQIPCPWCGERAQSEFSCHGEAHISRPTQSEEITDKQWGDYIFFRSNPKGIHYERWYHGMGCRRWFNVMRDTVSDKIHKSYKIGEEKPKLPASTASASSQSNNNKTS